MFFFSWKKLKRFIKINISRFDLTSEIIVIGNIVLSEILLNRHGRNELFPAKEN